MRLLGAVAKWLALALAGLLTGRGESRERLVEPAATDRRAESVVLVLLLATAAAAALFVVLYAIDASTQMLGLSLGAALTMLAAALIVVGKRLVATEELEEDYPEPDEQEADAVAQIVREGGSGFTRKRLLGGAAAAAGGALGAAAVVPALSLGPVLDTDELRRTPWRRGVRLVDDRARPLSADAIEEGAFYTAFPEGARHDLIGAPLIVVRLAPPTLALPAERAGWAPEGIVAYSKICTHAGCAIALYRNPLFEPAQPDHALVCPCHYSTFDPRTGGEVTFGPAGRALPQLPLSIGSDGVLVAAGDFSGPVGPSWSGVRGKGPV